MTDSATIVVTDSVTGKSAFSVMESVTHAGDGFRHRKFFFLGNGRSGAVSVDATHGLHPPAGSADGVVPTDAAERTLRVRLDGAHAAMLRRGVAPDIAENQVRALEVAARAVLRTLTMRGGDVA